ncbi:MAG: head GIN domain-containing protein [Phaeodactylibacter sp.]|uniref:head GIN domain-containing protein n=1 Tax=Phaeodactylibacter sp. TaxID=1940289 RepID=UPI0032EF1C5A
MNTILRAIVILILLGFAMSGKAQETRKLEHFDAVSVTGDISVTLVQGDAPSAMIETDGIDADDITLYVKGKTLKIQLIEGLFSDFDRVEITLTYTKLRAIKSSAGASVRTAGTLTGDELNLRASSGGELFVEVAVNAIEASASEGGVLTISGETEDQEVSVSTGGVYEGLELQCMRTYVKSNTGGMAEVVANKRLDANANTGGSIEYAGDPEIKNMRSLISGGIRKL